MKVENINLRSDLDYSEDSMRLVYPAADRYSIVTAVFLPAILGRIKILLPLLEIQSFWTTHY